MTSPTKRRRRTARPWTDDEREKFTEMWNAGILAKVIAGEFGITKYMVTIYRQRWGLPARYEPNGDTQYDSIKMEKSVALKARRIAAYRGISLTHYIRTLIEADHASV